MSTGKGIEKICIWAAAAALLISILVLSGAALGLPAGEKAMGYEERLFDTSRVHTLDIVMDGWDAFLETAQTEEYAVCNVVIDGETFKNVGIRGKGNTSLTTVASMDSDRYSFKIEFDQYDSTKSYYGLDKLSLNNLIQDNTMMKDYLTYRMMNEFGVAAPLCSFVYITVNGQDWGLYLAVEAVEESFLQRNFGSNYGDLYKPDGMNMGGGRGNGKDFDFGDFMGSADEENPSGSTMPDMPGGMGQGMGGNAPEMPNMPGGFDPSQMGGMGPGQWGQQAGQMPPDAGTGATGQGGFDPSRREDVSSGGLGGLGIGSAVTKLQYIDDDPDSYSDIFGSAKTDVTAADQTRLVAALEDLSRGKDSAVDVEAVIRYFVVHNFVVNGDSYTGSMIHNYYLYEKDGALSMIPWDYNLAFGTFQGNSANDAVNDDIDAPLSVTGDDRPMIDWIFSSGEYTELYHGYFREFLDTVDPAAIISEAKALIAPYVLTDPTRFCTYEEFEKAVETLTAFCDLRSRSVAQQLGGGEGTVDASGINLSDMGTMGGRGQQSDVPTGNSERPNSAPGNQQMPQMPGGQGGMGFPGGTGMPEGMKTVFPGQDDAVQGRSPNRGLAEAEPAQDSNQWVLLAITALILAAGLLLAFKFKRR